MHYVFLSLESFKTQILDMHRQNAMMSLDHQVVRNGRPVNRKRK